jgi:hypothetical protein
MELNDDILVQTTSLQTIARVKRVKSRLLQKVAQKMRAICSHPFAPICMVCTISLA